MPAPHTAGMRDAIMVLGGGLRDGGRLPAYSKRRFDLALEKESGEPMVALSGWTAHRPVMLTSDGQQLYESTAGARYLMERGIGPERIFCETTSYDTIGNAYFSRLQLAGPLGWRRLLIVTSQFHMARTKAIFRWIYGLDARQAYQLDFAESANDGLDAEALSARLEHEIESLRRVEQLRCELDSLRALAQWLFTEHRQYRAVRETSLERNARLLDSY